MEDAQNYNNFKLKINESLPKEIQGRSLRNNIGAFGMQFTKRN